MQVCFCAAAAAARNGEQTVVDVERTVSQKVPV